MEEEKLSAKSKQAQALQLGRSCRSMRASGGTFLLFTEAEVNSETLMNLSSYDGLSPMYRRAVWSMTTSFGTHCFPCRPYHDCWDGMDHHGHYYFQTRILCLMMRVGVISPAELQTVERRAELTARPDIRCIVPETS